MEDILGFVANLIQVGSFIFVLVLFLRERQRLRRFIQARETHTSERPWVLIIGIGQDIVGQVRPFIQRLNLPGFTGEQIESYIVQGHLPAEQFYKALQEVLRRKQRLSQAGATEVHLFYMGPVTLAMGIGSILDNWVPVKVYKYEQGTYRLDFVLEKGNVLGLESGGGMPDLS